MLWSFAKAAHLSSFTALDSGEKSGNPSLSLSLLTVFSERRSFSCALIVAFLNHLIFPGTSIARASGVGILSPVEPSYDGSLPGREPPSLALTLSAHVLFAPDARDSVPLSSVRIMAPILSAINLAALSALTPKQLEPRWSVN